MRRAIAPLVTAVTAGCVGLRWASGTAPVRGKPDALPSYDPATVDPQRLMVVTTKYLRDSRRSRLAAQRLLETIQARIDVLPTVFLAEVVAGPWPTGLMSDSLRVAIRRRIAKGVLDLNGTDVARVFIAWAKPDEHRGDVVLFKRLGKLVSFNINDIRDATVLIDLLRAIKRANLKPPPGFVALLGRRVVALDRVDPLSLQLAFSFLSVLDEHGGLDTPTATALVNRIVSVLRNKLEQQPAASLGAAGESQRDKEPVSAAALAEATGVPADIAQVAARDIDREAALSAEAPAGRDTRWPLTGQPMREVSLSADEAKRILGDQGVTVRRVFSLLTVMQEHSLTSPLYSRPVVPFVVPAVRMMHPLEVLRFIREGGMKRIVSPQLATAILKRLGSVDLDFATRATLLQSIVRFVRHLDRKVKRSEADPDQRELEASLSEGDKAAFRAFVEESLDRLDRIDEAGITVRPLIAALVALADLAESGFAATRERLVQIMPRLARRVRQHVDSAAVSLSQCDEFLSVASRLRWEDPQGDAGDLAAIKAERQAAEEAGRQRTFECKLQAGRQVYRELVDANAKVTEHRGSTPPSVFDRVMRLALSRHPMSVLEALASFENDFPKALSPALRREVARALIIKLKPGAPTSTGETGSRRKEAVPLTAAEWPRFVELIKTVGPESLVTAPSTWRFVLERNKLYGDDAETRKYAEEMLSVFDRRR